MIKTNKIRGEKRASALLVAILVMGVLLTLTLGLSTLIVREIRQTADIVAAGQAYFAAEAGMENALLDLAENLPGYENVVLYPDMNAGQEDENLNYEYVIGNKGDKYPFFPDDQPVFLGPDSAIPKSVLYDPGSGFTDLTYNVLPLNESVTIPLFTVDDNGEVNNIQQFLVQYYVNFDDNLLKRTQIQDMANGSSRSLKLDDFDILRWKVFGNPCVAGNCDSPDLLKTDAISDFYPATEGVSSERPVCIGTPSMLSEYNVNCFAPVIQDVIKVGEFAKVDDLPWDKAGFSFARQCYVSEVTDQSVGSLKGEVVMTQCNIDRFIQTHTRNYVTLTNMVNPDLIGINPETTPQYANIYYRIITSGGVDNSIVREFADIRADGYSRGGDVRQSINAKLRLSSFLPVFNFSLYRTDTTTDEVDSPFRRLPGLLQSSPAVSGLGFKPL